MIDIVDYLDRETRRLKVDVNLGAQIAPDDLEEIRRIADHVVLATGSRVAALPAGPAARGAVSVDDVLTGHLPPEPGQAVVYDEGDGFWPAYSAAEALAQRGWQVTLRDRADRARRTRAPRERRPAAAAAGRGGRDHARGHPRWSSRRTRPSRWPCVPSSVEPIVELEPALLVWHQPRIGADELTRSTPVGDTITAIGDCVTPRRIGHAIAEGYRLGATV